MMNLQETKQDSAYDFEFTREIKDALSIAPSRGGGESVCSSVSRLRTSHSHTRGGERDDMWKTRSSNPHTLTSVGGSDALSVASTSMINLVSNRHGVASSASAGGKLKNNQTPSDVAKGWETQIDQLVERTVLLKKQGKLEESLESAKEGTKKEQLLRKHRKANSLSVNSEAELMYSTWFNLAAAYEANDMPEEALKTYTYLAKQRGNPFTGRLRINMGNIYYAQQKYPSAIKMYKMALDQMRKDDKSIAHKIRRNIGNAFFRLGKIREAVKNYEEAMDVAPDFQTGFNLLVCHLALGDVESTKKDFITLAEIPADKDVLALKEAILMGEANAPYEIKQELDSRLKKASHFLLTAARLIAPILDSKDWASGYDWVCITLEDHHEELATQMKLEQATQRLKRKEFGVAVKNLKSLQKKGEEVKAATATNLSFVSFLEGNIERASKYADVALAQDRYSPKALVNKGNCMFVNGEVASAKNLYLEAIGVQADCIQAIFNLGLANAQLGLAEEAIHAFEKVHRITPNNPQILYQIADICELQGRSQDAMKWFNVLAARVPSDPTNLTRLGQIYVERKDESQGLHYQLESFRQYPIDLDVISWIGSWFVQQEMYERSIFFFQQASLIQPKEIKWGFMVASAHKRCGNLDMAFHEYEKLHDQFSENTECLRHLVSACETTGKPSYKYQDKLDKLMSNN